VSEKFTRMFPRSKVAGVCAGVYLLAFLSLTVYAYFDKSDFSGLPAVLLTWPWIDYVPLLVPANVAVPLCAILNTALIYVLFAFLAQLLWGKGRGQA
jgi:hypothetical protein